MKAFLMHRDRDFDLNAELPPNEGALTQDLELNTLIDAMAAGDQYLSGVARLALMRRTSRWKAGSSTRSCSG